ncbi:AIPR family protein [Komarekiella sp. 'clone 1']|uniref:AIPR family protein n=1 Tax=Komarekiella delphini-convector SJRDD-AB1 TaxID=2593771 RepID=A0AA40SZZ8_9NOST|nr:AIPR family protein [Komarekiella delphini-convector]MBD6618118.1 AIPR family protein [Komarekiella delphini-convector SJRDD-AB1]
MDRITVGLLNTFRKQQSFSEDLKESDLFEHFVNYYVISKEYNYQFGLEEIHVGGSGDKALDGIAIIVNGSLINSKEELEDLQKRNKYLDVEFILIQSKTSSSFDAGEIAKFLLGSTDFFNEESELPANAQIREKSQLMGLIYEKSSLFKNRKPICKLYYVTTGKWFDDKHLKVTIEGLRKRLDDMEIFERVTFNPIDANGIQNLYRLANNKISRQIKFERRATIPKIEDINQAYIAILPASEYLKLITDDDDNLIRGLFYDNVRGFQGENDVNQEIEATIKSDERQFFVLYNNGITIVAEYVDVIGDLITIKDYQIVNGCQTSYILYNSRESIDDSLCIPIKVIALDRDSKLKNNIIKANNRQTPVKLEELEALTDFQKKLEEYYNSIPEEKRLYYERRPRQFNGIDDIEKIIIVDIRSQMRCFASMFLDQAQNAGRYHTRLQEETKEKIFLPSHHPIGYYVSAYAKFCLDALFRKRLIDPKYSPFKYYILNILRIQVSGKIMPDITSNKFIKYCETLEQALWDENQCRDVLLDTINIVDQAVNGDYDRAVAKTVGFSNAINNCFK